MTTISLRATGLDKLQTGFAQFVKTIEPVSEQEPRAALERARAVSPGYLGGSDYTTPEPPNSGYQRTGNLGRSAYVEQDGLSSRLIVNAYSPGGQEYGVYVVGDAAGQGQAAIHAGRWPTLRSAVDAQIDQLTTVGQGLDAALQDSAKAAGL